MIKLVKYNPNRFTEKTIPSIGYDPEAKYKLFNKLYFDNELPMIKFKALTSLKKATIAHAEGHETIAFNIDNFSKLSDKNKDAILLHEMIHIWVSFKGYPFKGNIHQGAFNVKAKELEQKSKLNLIGRFHKDSDDLEQKYSGMEKKKVYLVFVNSTIKLLKKNLRYVEFFSTLEKAENFAKEKGENRTRNDFWFIYEVTANSPILEYDKYSKYLDKFKAWLVLPSQTSSFLLEKIKEFPQYAKFIDRYPHWL